MKSGQRKLGQVNIPVNVGEVSGVRYVRGYDSSFSGTPDSDAGKITITGTLGTGGVLRVLVAGPGQSWPEDIETNMTEVGVQHLGLTGEVGIEVDDPALRAKTRLMAYISGNVRGTIAVGQVRRIQAGNLDPETPTGNITANVTSVGSSVPMGELPPESPFGYVIAGNSISGTIKAELGNIDRVQVGPNRAAAGIQGDIFALNGRIKSVYTTGPIGAESNIVSIWAGKGMTEVRATDETTDYIDADFFADIDSGRNYGTPTGDVFQDGACGLIQTGGNFTGSIHAGSMLPVEDGQRAGVYVAGDITGDIAVDFLVEGNIVGSRLLGSIEVGYFVEGAIIATAIDDTNAVTPLISIGYGAANAAYDSAPTSRGFVGSASSFSVCPSINPRNAAQMADLYATGLACDSEGTGPSVIAVPHVADLRPASVTAYEYAPYYFGEEDVYTRAPSIEVATIGSLTIGMLREGSVWSGVFDDDSVPPVDTNRADDFASIAEIHIGSIGQGGRIWARDFTKFTVQKSMNGEVRVPVLAAPQMIVIGGGLGVYNGSLACGCVQSGFDCDDDSWIPLAEPNDSPRSSTRFAAGKIDIDGALAGQIILNAEGAVGVDPDDYWAGAVRVNGTATTPIILAKTSSAPDTAPYYA